MATQIGARVVQGQGLHPLLPEEIGTLGHYTENNLASGVSRGFEALRSEEKIQTRMKNHTTHGAKVGFGAGLVVGIGVSIFMPGALPVSLGVKAGLFGIAKAGIIGAVGGGSLGAATGATYSIATLNQSPEYLNWRGKMSNEKVIPIWRNFIDQFAEELKEFECPITHEIIIVPVRAADGKIYEKTEIVEWIRSAEEVYNALPPHLQTPQARVLTSPSRICALSVDTLVYAPDYHKKLFDRLRSVYNAAVVRELGARIALNREILNDALRDYQNTVMLNRKAILQQRIGQLAQQLAAGQINENIFTQQTKDAARLVTEPRPIFA